MTVDSNSRSDLAHSRSRLAGSDVDAMHAHLDHLVQANPQQAIAEGRRILGEQSDPRVVMNVWAAIGRALYELGDMTRATVAMRQALKHGDALTSGIGVTNVRISAAAIFAEAGELRSALQQLDHAEMGTVGSVLGRVRTQRGFVLAHAGRLVEARRQADLAEEALKSGHDRLALLRMLVNRSLISLQLGELDHAESDLTRARVLADRLGQSLSAALIVANLGVLHARAGRIVVALEHFALADEMYVAAGSPLRTMAILEADRAETMLRAGLFEDAVIAAHRAVAHATASGNLVSRSDAELLLARSQLAAGQLAAARRTATGAATMLRAGHRRGVALQARAIGLQAAFGSATSNQEVTRLFDRSRRLGERLEREGWTEMSDDLRCARLRCASRLERLDEVADDLAALRRSLRVRHPAVALRAWYAESLAHVHEGDAAAAMRVARRGMNALDRFRQSSGDLQIRVGLAAIGDDLASLGIGTALASGSVSAVFTWAELTRGHAYSAGGTTTAVSRRLPRRSEVIRRLQQRVMIEFIVHGGEVHAVIIHRSGSHVVFVGAEADVRRGLDQTTAWLDRAMQPSNADRAVGAAAAAARLSDLLIAPLRLGADDDDVVIVPAGLLHAVPWSSLPGLRSARVSVSLSARTWMVSDARAEQSVRSITGLIGPAVAGAAVERRALRREYPGVEIVGGRRSTGARLRDVLANSDAVHLAAHGRFRADSPLGSTLDLADGELAVYALNVADVQSRMIVLSSCEAGLLGVRSGGEALGLVAVLLSRGAATVIAPVHTVPDAVCARFISEFHAEWASGSSAAEALAEVRRRWLERPNITRWATAASFTCFGSGSTRFEPSHR